MIGQVISVFFATYGFGYLFHIRSKKLLYASLGGMLGGLVFYLCNWYGMHYFLVNLFTALVLSLYSEIMSRYLKCPVTILLISEIICFVPGGLMYRSMEELIKSNSALSLQYGIEVLGSAVALAIGIMLATSLFRVALFWQTQMVKSDGNKSV